MAPFNINRGSQSSRPTGNQVAAATAGAYLTVLLVAAANTILIEEWGDKVKLVYIAFVGAWILGLVLGPIWDLEKKRSLSPGAAAGLAVFITAVLGMIDSLLVSLAIICVGGPTMSFVAGASTRLMARLIRQPR